MTRTHLLIAAVFVAIAVALLWPRTEASDQPEPSAKPTDSAPASAPAASTGIPAEPTRADAPTAPRVDPAKRERHRRLVAAISAARTGRRASNHTAGGGGNDELPPGEPSLPAEYIEESLKEVLPLVKECYDHALEASPSLAGSVAIEFTIAGEPDVGGVVVETAVDPSAELADQADMLECVKETIYALELPPPRDGGETIVTIPFTFAPPETE